MITAVAFVPSAPMLIPAVASGAAHELEDLRQLSINAVADVVASADEVIIVGAGATTRVVSSGTGTMRGFGVPFDISLGDGQGADIGLAGTIGLWLVSQTSWQGPRSVIEVSGDADLVHEGLTSASEAIALIVVGDGSAARTEKAPGYVHPDAEAFDQEVERALVAGDAAGLAQLDSNRAHDVMARGVDVWHVVAKAVAGTAILAQLQYAQAPYGVGYFVAMWHCDQPQA